MSLVELGFQYYPDPTKGRPVYNGSIYIGLPDTDPKIVSNQKVIQIRQEDGTLVPVSQPVKTGGGGVPLYNGSPVGIVLPYGEPYSIRVDNSEGSQVYYNAELSNFTEEINSRDYRYGVTFATVAAFVGPSPVSLDGIAVDLDEGKIISTKGRFDGWAAMAEPQGNAEYEVMTLASYGKTPDELGAAFTLANGNVAVLKPNGPITLKQFGAGYNGADESANIQAAFDSGFTRIHAPQGTYNFSTRIDVDVRGLVFYGDGIDATIFNYSGAGDAFYLTAGQMRISDFEVNGGSTTGACFQTSEAATAKTSGVFDFYNVRANQFGHMFDFGESPTDSNQADTKITRCIAFQMSSGVMRIQHDQGVNYEVDMCTFAEVNGPVFEFQNGGRLIARQNAMRNVGTILKSSGGIKEITDYFYLDGISIDGNVVGPYPQWHKLLDITNGRVYIKRYSSGNANATVTDPLITINGTATVKFEDSNVLPEYTWDGATGIPMVEISGLGDITGAEFIADNIYYGESTTPKNYVSILKRNNNFCYTHLTNIKTRGYQRFATNTEALIGGSVGGAPIGASDVSVPFFGSLTYVPLIGNQRVSNLAITLLSGSITGADTVTVKLQRNIGGVLSTQFTYTMDSTTTFPHYLIGQGDHFPARNYFGDTDQLRVAINDGGTGVTATFGVTVGLSPA